MKSVPLAGEERDTLTTVGRWISPVALLAMRPARRLGDRTQPLGIGDDVLELLGIGGAGRDERRRATGRRRARRNERADDDAGSDPGVEYGDEADLGAEVLRVGGDPAQRLGRGPEQDGVDRLLVLEGDLGHRSRQREHRMEVRHR